MDSCFRHCSSRARHGDRARARERVEGLRRDAVDVARAREGARERREGVSTRRGGQALRGAQKCRASDARNGAREGERARRGERGTKRFVPRRPGAAGRGSADGEIRRGRGARGGAGGQGRAARRRTVATDGGVRRRVRAAVHKLCVVRVRSLGAHGVREDAVFESRETDVVAVRDVDVLSRELGALEFEHLFFVHLREAGGGRGGSFRGVDVVSRHRDRGERGVVVVVA